MDPRGAKLRIGVTAIVVFVVSFILNAATPFIADDYTFAYVFGTATRVKGLGDILRSQAIFYMTRNGRVVGGFFEQLAVLVGKPAFNVMNALMFVALVFVIYLNANGRRRPSPALFAAVPLALWFALPSFGQSALFAAGSTNYVWLATLAMAALLPFRFHADDASTVADGPAAIVGMFFLGVLAGWTNENLGPTVALLMVAYVVYYRRAGITVPGWAVSAMIGAFTGAAMLVGAPGNYATLAEAGGAVARPGLGQYAERFAAITHAIFLDHLFTIMTVFLVAAVVVVYQRCARSRSDVTLGSLYVGAAFIATYAMVLSPFFPPRAWTGILVLAIAGAGVVLRSIELPGNLSRRLLAVIIVCATIMFSVRFAYVYVTDIARTRREWDARITRIESERAAGRLDIVTGPIIANTSYNAAYDIKDLDERPDEWPNVDVARYFGVHSIRATAGSR